MSDAQVSATIDAIKKRTDDVHVFISYSHDDAHLAEVFRDELLDINPDRVTVFLDAYSIRSGERWEPKIISNLKAADWLIFLYTGRERRPYDYCGFEIGIFTAVHHLNNSSALKDSSRLICLHDTNSVPSLLSMVQNCRIRCYQPNDTKSEYDFYVESPAAQFFEDFYEHPKNNPIIRSTMNRSNSGGSLLKHPTAAREIVDRVKRLAKQFQEARKNDPISEKFYQVRMEIDIRDSLPKSTTEIPGRSTITALQDMFNLIGLSPDPDEKGEVRISWDEMKDSLKGNNETSAWMDKIEDDILDAVHQRNLRSPETTFRGHDGQFYRPLLARQIIYGSGARKFSVIFVRTLPRRFAGDETTSAMLVGLILASRFRFTFIEARENLLRQTFGEKTSDAEFQLACRQLIYDIERMEQESSEFGMNSPELLQNAFGPGNYEIVRGFYEIWFPTRDALIEVLRRRIADPSSTSREMIQDQLKKFSDTIGPYNRRFLELCLQEYSNYLRRTLGPGDMQSRGGE